MLSASVPLRQQHENRTNPLEKYSEAKGTQDILGFGIVLQFFRNSYLSPRMHIMLEGLVAGIPGQTFPSIILKVSTGVAPIGRLCGPTFLSVQVPM